VQGTGVHDQPTQSATRRHGKVRAIVATLVDPTDTQLAFYAGWPVAMSGASVAKDVLEQAKSNAYDGLL
jgi:hypothetical protein